MKPAPSNYGSTLPDLGSIPANTKVYFVLKTPNFITPSTPCYTAVYNASSRFLGEVSNADAGPEYYVSGDSANLSISYRSDSYSQLISTKTKQW